MIIYDNNKTSSSNMIRFRTPILSLIPIILKVRPPRNDSGTCSRNTPNFPSTLPRLEKKNQHFGHQPFVPSRPVIIFTPAPLHLQNYF